MHSTLCFAPSVPGHGSFGFLRAASHSVPVRIALSRGRLQFPGGFLETQLQ